jgi:hypothetical protein
MTEPKPAKSPPLDRASKDDGKAHGLLATLRRTLGGTVQVAADVGPTSPVGEAWDAEVR